MGPRGWLGRAPSKVLGGHSQPLPQPVPNSPWRSQAHSHISAGSASAPHGLLPVSPCLLSLCSKHTGPWVQDPPYSSITSSPPTISAKTLFKQARLWFQAGHCSAHSQAHTAFPETGTCPHPTPTPPQLGSDALCVQLGQPLHQKQAFPPQGLCLCWPGAGPSSPWETGRAFSGEVLQSALVERTKTPPPDGPQDLQNTVTALGERLLPRTRTRTGTCQARTAVGSLPHFLRPQTTPGSPSTRCAPQQGVREARQDAALGKVLPRGQPGLHGSTAPLPPLATAAFNSGYGGPVPSICPALGSLHTDVPFPTNVWTHSKYSDCFQRINKQGSF